ncbi:hypothetical protein CsSME_00039019 [Camellia sinensis var. sinensis]
MVICGRRWFPLTRRWFLARKGGCQLREVVVRCGLQQQWLKEIQRWGWPDVVANPGDEQWLVARGGERKEWKFIF